MLATALSVPGNMIDMRIDPANASQVRTKVVFPVSSQSSRQFRFDQPGARRNFTGGDRVAQLSQGLLAQACLGQTAETGP